MMKERTSILIEALPYIKKFSGKTFVIKYGGSVFSDSDIRNGFFEDIALLKLVGINVIIVHGGGPEIKILSEQLGLSNKFHEGLRITDSSTLEVVEMVLSGNINKKIASELCLHGLKGMGLSGRDNNLIKCKKHIEFKDDKEIDLGYVGDITNINTVFLKKLVDSDYIPVIAPIGCDENGLAYNINADSAAGEVSGYMEAEKLILITDVDGIFSDPNDKSTLVSKIDVDGLEKMKKFNSITGGMIPKVQCCIDSIKKGTKKVHIINGKRKHSILEEIFTNDGIGTMIEER